MAIVVPQHFVMLFCSFERLFLFRPLETVVTFGLSKAMAIVVPQHFVMLFCSFERLLKFIYHLLERKNNYLTLTFD